MVTIVRSNDPNWTLRVLKDLRAFFDKNGMHNSADAVVATLRVVRIESLSVENQTDVTVRTTLSQLQ